VRILHVDGSSRWGGGQNQIRLLMHELARRNVRQLCLCPAASPLERRLRSEGLPAAAMAWRGGFDLRVIRAILRLSKDHDLLHCHDSHALQVCLFPAWLRKKPMVATRRVQFSAKPAAWNRPERVIAITEWVKHRLLESGIDESRITVIHSAIDIDEVKGLQAATPSLRDRLGVDEDEFLVGTVGAMFEFKNQKLIPHAAALERSILWVIVGEGPERPNIETAIKAHGVEANVRLAGAPADARPFIREFDAFIFTSRGEALGTSLLDAMALDVPVIAPDDGGPGELLAPVHAVTGASLYPADNATALAAAVRRVRDEPALRKVMIEAQRVRLGDFRIQQTADSVLDVYRDILGG
jgi:glycosyltransferase involved in cell wall biosynthesis